MQSLIILNLSFITVFYEHSLYTDKEMYKCNEAGLSNGFPTKFAPKNTFAVAIHHYQSSLKSSKCQGMSCQWHPPSVYRLQ